MLVVSRKRICCLYHILAIWVVLANLGAVGARGAETHQAAFPTAKGYGRLATGWRGGSILWVTTLADRGAGSLRECAEDTRGPRVCIFRVSGTIVLDSPIRVASNTYIAGQTAPGKGVQLRLGSSQHTPLLVSNAEQILIRHLKIRPGASQRPSVDVDGVGIVSSRHVYLDHLSIQFATDENFSVSAIRSTSSDITISSSIIAYGLDRANHPKGRHSKGALICPRSKGRSNSCGRISIIGNLFANNRDRNPDLTASKIGGIEVVNNVFYNAISQFGEFYNWLGPTRVNYIGNVILSGPSTRQLKPPAAIEAFAPTEFQLQIYEKDNIYWRRGSRCLTKTPQPIVDEKATNFLVAVPPISVTHIPNPADATLDNVLNAAGARQGYDGPDSLDELIMNGVRTCGGQVIDHVNEVNGWPTLRSVPAPADTDRDGMPDTWENSHQGLHPEDPADAWDDRDNDGWSNLEEYLNRGDPSLRSSKR